MVSSLGGLVFGYELGIISGALLQLKAEFGLSCVQQEALVSALLVGALLASLVGGYLIDRRGRRNSILLSNLLILAGSLVLLVSSYPALVLGRVTVGFAMCISSMSCCIFVSELVRPRRRGFLVTLYEAGITVGILAAYAVNYILSGTSGGWKWMFGFAVVPTLLQLASIWFLPSNSKECVRREDGARPERDLTSPIEHREPDDAAVRPTERHTFMYLFQRKDNMRTRTVIGLALVIFQQLTGQPNVLLYASTIFHSAGFHSEASAVLASVGVGVIKVIATLVSMVFSDRVGRRPLLIGGCFVMALGLMTIGLLSGRSFSDASRPCVSEDVMTNATSLPRVTPDNQSLVDSLVNRTQEGGVLLDKQKSLEVQGAVVSWMILVCMLGVVAAYSAGFGPSDYFSFCFDTNLCFVSSLSFCC